MSARLTGAHFGIVNTLSVWCIGQDDIQSASNIAPAISITPGRPRLLQVSRTSHVRTPSTHFETRPRASPAFCEAADPTSCGVLGSGSYKSEGSRTSSSNASISIFLKAYSPDIVFGRDNVGECRVSVDRGWTGNAMTLGESG